jgi:hypothetical protein
MLKRTLLSAAVLTALAGVAGAPRADEGAKKMVSEEKMTYCHLYTDGAGVSHFRDEQLVLKPAGTSGREARLLQYALSNAPGAQLLALKLGAREDWHNAPRRMYLIALKGMSQVTVGDGEVRRFGPGSVLLMDDATGKGHITEAVGTEDHVALTIPAPAG